MDLSVGAIVDGKVTGITKFGAFVALPENKSGMVHISEVANSYVSDIKEHLKEGQEVTVKIINIDKEGRLNLSIKKAQAAPPVAQKSEASFGFDRKRQKTDNLTFEDKLKQFMSDSESKISDLKSNMDKKGGARRRAK